MRMARVPELDMMPGRLSFHHRPCRDAAVDGPDRVLMPGLAGVEKPTPKSLQMSLVTGRWTHALFGAVPNTGDHVATTRPVGPDPSFPMGLAELFDAHGWPRMVGRVLGELLLADPPYLSTAELCGRIPTSKGHLSTTMSILSSMGMVERFGVPGSRRDHYRLSEDAFVRAMGNAAEPSRRLAAAATRALADVPPGSRASQELTRMRDFYTFLARRLPQLIEEFEGGAR